MNTPPVLTRAALALLDGRAVYVRSSRRHGCCGGAASMPTAEPGAPATLDGLERFDVSGTAVYVEPHMNPNDNSWAIDVDGFARWRRLVVLGLDLTAVTDAPPPRHPPPQPTGPLISDPETNPMNTPAHAPATEPRAATASHTRRQR